MPHTTLIVPGFRGSGAQHWQSWLQARVPGAQRVGGIDWHAPVLTQWAAQVRGAIMAAPGPVWLVAHSFGCLASVAAAADRPHNLAGLLLVAPADPKRFSGTGLCPATSPGACVINTLPQRYLGVPNILVASRNDPWLAFDDARLWAQRWGSRLVDLGAAGHVNLDSGFGPWPGGLELLRSLQQQRLDPVASHPHAPVDAGPNPTLAVNGPGHCTGARDRRGTRPRYPG